MSECTHEYYYMDDGHGKNVQVCQKCGEKPTAPKAITDDTIVIQPYNFKKSMGIELRSLDEPYRTILLNAQDTERKLTEAMELLKETLDHDCQPDKAGTCRYAPPKVCSRHQRYEALKSNVPVQSDRDKKANL